MFLRVPQLGDDLKDAQIVKWLVSEGDKVKKDQDLVELVTDKVCFVVPSPVDGVIKKILKREGELLGEELCLAEIEEDVERLADA